MDVGRTVAVISYSWWIGGFNGVFEFVDIGGILFLFYDVVYYMCVIKYLCFMNGEYVNVTCVSGFFMVAGTG